jgi:hypothetical protein
VEVDGNLFGERISNMAAQSNTTQLLTSDDTGSPGGGAPPKAGLGTKVAKEQPKKGAEGTGQDGGGGGQVKEPKVGLGKKRQR